MRARSLLTLVLLVLPAPAAAGEASVGYRVSIESPDPVTTGVTTVRIRVSGGFRDAHQAAFLFRKGEPWEESAAVPMTRVGEDLFEASWNSEQAANAAYRLEVRAWGEVPPYDPADGGTYAGEVIDVAVDNPPTAPAEVQGVTPAASVRVGWSSVPGEDREDFGGYRVFVRRSSKGAACPGEGYASVTEVRQAIYTSSAVSPGWYCFRVAAIRASAVSGSILSPLTPPVRIRVVRGASGGLGGTTAPPVPPPPPVLGEGSVSVADGGFGEGLPYDPRTVTQEVAGEEGGAAGTEAREAGVDPRRTPTLVAAGLVLAVAAMLIRRFLWVPRLP